VKRYEVPQATSSSSTSPSSSTNNDQMLQMMLALVSENTAVLKDLRDKGVIGKFFKTTFNQLKNTRTALMILMN
jgi:hypothetical protein